MTQREKLLSALQARGWTVCQKQPKNYVALEYPGKEKKAFIGKAGALRLGRNVTESCPILDEAKQNLLKEGESK